MILVLITQDRGEIEESSLQGLTLARSLDDDLHVAAVGVEIDGLSQYGVAVQHVIKADGLDDYNPMAWGSALAQLMTSLSPGAVVATGTERGNEVMAHVGAISGLPMVANCVEIDATPDVWDILRTRWGGSLLESTTLDAPIKLVTVAEHTVEDLSVEDPPLDEVIAEIFLLAGNGAGAPGESDVAAGISKS